MPKLRRRNQGSEKNALPPSREREFRTDQESFWVGDFGNSYTVRNQGDKLVASNAALFSHILERTGRISSAIEFGANVGLNLRALRLLVPDMKLAAVEINAQAVVELKKMRDVTVHHRSILEFKPKGGFDLAFTKGVLIHINPDELRRVYATLHASSRRFVCIAEYYNPTPVGIPYRGHADRLFKRDFAGEMLQLYPDLRLRDYGFVYHGDANFPQDDITWFLMEKTKSGRKAASRYG